MKIAMVSHYFGSHRGGIEIVAEKLFAEFAKRGETVVWIAADVTPPPESSGSTRTVPIRVFNTVEEKTGIPLPIPRLSEISKLRREVADADVVILQDCLYVSNILAYLFAKFRHIPVIVIQHLGFVPYNNALLNAAVKLGNRLVTRRLLSNAEQVVFISETTKSFFDRLFYKTPPELIFNGVDPVLYRTLQHGENKSAFRALYGLPEDCPVILFVGRFVEKKGLPAMQRMVGLCPKWTWVFAGWGPLDPRYWNADNARVFSDLQGESLAALYRACDVLVLPSIGEGFPLVIQEALASGLGVVCGDETLRADAAMEPFVRSVPVCRNDNERTARQFVAAIQEFINSDETTPEKSKARRVFAMSHYSWSRSAERYLEIAKRLVPQAAMGHLSIEASTAGVLR